MPQRIYTMIDIDASAEKVWQVLTDFDRYPEWNPFVRSVEGICREGMSLRIRLLPPQGKAMTINPCITNINPARQLIWIGRVLFPGLFDGEHVFDIESLGAERVRFHQSENFSGLLSRLILTFIAQPTEAGFHAMNKALKQRIEENDNGQY